MLALNAIDADIGQLRVDVQLIEHLDGAAGLCAVVGNVPQNIHAGGSGVHGGHGKDQHFLRGRALLLHFDAGLGVAELAKASTGCDLSGSLIRRRGGVRRDKALLHPLIAALHDFLILVGGVPVDDGGVIGVGAVQQGADVAAQVIAGIQHCHGTAARDHRPHVGVHLLNGLQQRDQVFLCLDVAVIHTGGVGHFLHAGEAPAHSHFLVGGHRVLFPVQGGGSPSLFRDLLQQVGTVFGQVFLHGDDLSVVDGGDEDFAVVVEHVQLLAGGEHQVHLVGIAAEAYPHDFQCGVVLFFQDLTSCSRNFFHVFRFGVTGDKKLYRVGFLAAPIGFLRAGLVAGRAASGFPACGGRFFSLSSAACES